MNPTTAFLRLLWSHLANSTPDPETRLCLVRTARARPITGGPIHGWSA
mgnify:CR=1 FL=1